MPNAIKYNTSDETLALKKGNFWIGTGDVGKGPTSSTGFYNGITPPSGGYTIYLNKASGGPSIYVTSTVAELTGLTSTIAGQSLTTSGACLNYFVTQTDKMIFNIDYPAIVTNGLVLNLDAGFTLSYSQSGVTWYDVSSSVNNGILTNGPTFNSENGGSIVFDGTNDFVSLGNQQSLQFTDNFSAFIWIKPTSQQFLKGIVGNASYNNGGWMIALANNFFKPIIVINSQTNQEVFGNTTLLSNTWYNIGFTFSSGVLTLYLNGSVDNTGSGLSITKNTTTFVIGRGSQGGWGSFTGLIPSTQVYNRTLSATEVLQNYEAIGTRYTTLQVQSLVVAGGGSGGGSNYPAGGGGAGGLLTGYTTSLTTNTNYTITVGAGGSSNSNGSNSVFNTLTSIGGGRGGNGRSASGVSGGSGGGGGSNYPADGGLINGLTPAGSGTVGQGNNGGVGKSVYATTVLNGIPTGAGGGGGAGTVGGVGGTGTTSPTLFAGSGGTGLYFSEYTSIGGSPNGWFAGGGGGSTSYSSTATNAVGVGGNGGGGNGSYTQFSSGPTATDGIVNTGGGGGGAGYGENSSANGGSGIVILKIPDVYTARFSSGVTSTVTKSGGYKYYKVTATSTTSETVSFS